MEFSVRFHKKSLYGMYSQVFIATFGNINRIYMGFSFLSNCMQFLRNKMYTTLLFLLHFFLNNQPDPLIIPILFSYKTLHVSDIFSAHHQEFSTVHSALVSFLQVSDDRFQTESRWNCSSILTLLGNCHQKPA